MSIDLYLLLETASGYALFVRDQYDELGNIDDGAAQTENLKDFMSLVKLRGFLPFTSAEVALSNINAIVAGECTEELKNFLSMNLTTQSKKKKKAAPAYKLGVADPKLGDSLNELGFQVTYSQSVRDMLRGCRQHVAKMVKMDESDLDKARCGLGHAYSRNKMQFDPNRQDKPIINAIAILDGLDKNINTFAMRVREWYSWHFPEMAKIVTDNEVFAKLACLIRLKDDFDWDNRMDEVIEACGGDEETAKELEKACRTSMGQDIVEMDMANIEHFAKQVISLSEMRRNLTDYLHGKMDVVAPNLAALIGDTVGARLISHAGSLTNLAKYPASTVQILGAEKALFRALKTKGNTPKYGLIYNSSFIGKAAQKNKGRISRYLANKCSLASRIDCFSDQPAGSSESCTVFGEKMRDQVEERLRYLTTEGVKPKRNVDVMREAMKEVEEIQENDKEAVEAAAADEEEEEVVVEKKAKKDKKAKKEKKRKHAEVEEEEVEEVAEPEEEEAPKKKHKHKKSKKHSSE
ncbi:Nucleolar protein Nop56, putative [Perkinsus marinus ATCC 50983]|uniref:Nucleolar protein 56 n=1 Tax=Perkinsus marinus (strain ATCC 50983 / TXsc) TaxID=423536 RepID=C5KNZ2_PERM5|nr:Nucleolar protein Nop56, putative [Perkinsus marinus ATCC 50983]EER13780.1 Nucleolar protein Nop56, putative [Perkinsus marinus ATCC 50983]|eukprot:XP_002781985.1 Nucleolar protein Nop56, putative [Perkinsus marinus ATCC 50983]